MVQTNICIRVKPLINKEQSPSETVHWKVQDNTILLLEDTESEEIMIQRNSFEFDRIFPSSSSTSEIFDEVALPVLDEVIDGHNGTIVAFGQKSSGKTHTMMGTENDLGVIPLMAKALFEAIEEKPSRTFLLKVSYLEIDDDKRVFDLLGIDKKELNVRTDENGIAFAENLQEVFVRNCEDLLKIVERGDLNRSYIYCSTSGNERSSNSHTIFTVIVNSVLTQEVGNGVSLVSRLNLVDLSGFLHEQQTREKESRKNSLHYWDNSLNQILQPSLDDGSAKTSIIFTVTPAAIDETSFTLQLASNIKAKDALLTEEIEMLAPKNESMKKIQEMYKFMLKLEETIGRIEVALEKPIIASYFQEARLCNMMVAIRKRIHVVEYKLTQAISPEENSAQYEMASATQPSTSTGGANTSQKFSEPGAPEASGPSPSKKKFIPLNPETKNYKGLRTRAMEMPKDDCSKKWLVLGNKKLDQKGRPREMSKRAAARKAARQQSREDHSA